MRVHYKRMEDVPAIVRSEYAAGHYVVNAPPVPHIGWGELAWINYVTFTRLTDSDLEVTKK